MQKVIIFVFSLIGVISSGYAQNNNIPKEVMSFLENNSARYKARGLETAKSMGYIPAAVRVEDLRVGRVLQIYRLKHVFLNNYPDTVQFNEIIEPTGYWFAHIMLNDKQVCQLFIDNSNGNPEFAGRSSPSLSAQKIWDSFFKAYPESTGINPVIFSQYGLLPFVPEERFLYFQQKGPRKIHYLKYNDYGDSLGAVFSGSIEKLDDTKKLIKYWKSKGLNEVGLSREERERRLNENVKTGW